MLPRCKKMNHMSWTFGSHMDESAIYFGGDNVVIRQNPKKIPMEIDY